MMGKYEQISLFEMLEKYSPFPCDNCIYDVKNCCDYPETLDDYCVLGSKQTKRMVM